jgi:hypothetical protein
MIMPAAAGRQGGDWRLSVCLASLFHAAGDYRLAALFDLGFVQAW